MLKEYFKKHSVELFAFGGAALIFGVGYILGATDWHHDMDSLVQASEDAAKETCQKVFDDGYNAGSLNAWCTAAYYDRDFVTDIFTKLHHEDMLKTVLEVTDNRIANGGEPR